MTGKQLNARLDEKQLRRLKRLAEHYGLSMQNVIRLLIKEKARELGYS